MTTPPVAVRTLPARRTRVSAKARRQAESRNLAVAVLRVSTRGQGQSGLGLDAQREAVEAFAAREGLTLVAVLTDVCSGKVDPAERAGMGEALRMLSAGEVGTLVTAKIDRLSRRNAHLYGLMDRGHREGWCLRTADGVLSTCSGKGRLMASVAAFVAELEAEMIADRTRSALAVKVAAGARLGAPIQTPQATRDRIRELRADGVTMQSIADRLNVEGITTANGQVWSRQNVQRVIGSLYRDDAAAARRVTTRAGCPA